MYFSAKILIPLKDKGGLELKIIEQKWEHDLSRKVGYLQIKHRWSELRSANQMLEIDLITIEAIFLEKIEIISIDLDNTKADFTIIKIRDTNAIYYKARH